MKNAGVDDRSHTTAIVIREILESDAAAYVELFERIVSESRYMLFLPGERAVSPEGQAAAIRRAQEGKYQGLLVAERDRELLGFVSVMRGGTERSSLTGALVIGVLADAQGRGLGKSLMQAAEAWARQQGLHRLELTVIDQNTTAVRLYERMGYAHEGHKRENLHLDGVAVGEYVMGKLLV